MKLAASSPALSVYPFSGVQTEMSVSLPFDVSSPAATVSLRSAFSAAVAAMFYPTGIRNNPVIFESC